MSLLQSVGLLGDDVALRANRCLRSEVQCQGLVIDDFFCVSIEDKITHGDQSISSKVYRKAQTAYNQCSILGSPQKDLDGVLCGKTIGMPPSTLDLRPPTVVYSLLGLRPARGFPFLSSQCSVASFVTQLTLCTSACLGRGSQC